MPRPPALCFLSNIYFRRHRLAGKWRAVLRHRFVSFSHSIPLSFSIAFLYTPLAASNSFPTIIGSSNGNRQLKHAKRRTEMPHSWKGKALVLKMPYALMECYGYHETASTSTLVALILKRCENFIFLEVHFRYILPRRKIFSRLV